MVDKLIGPRRDEAFMRQLAALDRCIVGMNLSLATYFGIRDGRVDAMVENLLAEQIPDDSCSPRGPWMRSAS